MRICRAFNTHVRKQKTICVLGMRHSVTEGVSLSSNPVVTLGADCSVTQCHMKTTIPSSTGDVSVTLGMLPIHIIKSAHKAKSPVTDRGV